MRKFCILLLLLSTMLAPAQTQQRRSSTGARKTSAAKPAPKQQPKTSPQKKKQGKQQQPSTPTISGLRSQRQQVQQQIREQQQRLKANRRDVQQRMQNLMVINSEIETKQRAIDTIRRDIMHLDTSIVALDNQMKELEAELNERKERYMKTMRYMHRNRSIQNQLMFVFSAQSFTQMYRRMRFMREYATYQRAQGEAVITKQAEVTAKYNELTAAKDQKRQLLARGQNERQQLESKQAEQQQVVQSLQKQQKTIEAIIAEQQKKDAALNAQIDRLVAEEVARQKARAEAERKKKAAEAAAAKKRAEELAAKKRAAAAAKKENDRRVAEARAREQKAKADARAAARKSAQEKAAAERAARDAENARKAAERRATADAKAHEKEVAKAEKSSADAMMMTSEDRRLSGSFESNKGRLPIPITGGYRVVGHHGTNTVSGLRNVTLDNKGVNIQGQAGAKARAVFDGVVSMVASWGGQMIVMVRHGSYISVYTNLSSTSVQQGQRVSARQTLGTVGGDNILHFQLRREKKKLNPEQWLGLR